MIFLGCHHGGLGSPSAWFCAGFVWHLVSLWLLTRRTTATWWWSVWIRAVSSHWVNCFCALFYLKDHSYARTWAITALVLFFTVPFIITRKFWGLKNASFLWSERYHTTLFIIQGSQWMGIILEGRTGENDRLFFYISFCSCSVSASQRTAITYSRSKVKSIIIIIMVILCTLSVTFLLVSPHILQISRKLGSAPPMEEEHKYFSSLQIEKMNVHTGFKQLLPGDSGWASPDMSSLCPHSKLTKNWAAITNELLSMS